MNIRLRFLLKNSLKAIAFTAASTESNDTTAGNQHSPDDKIVKIKMLQLELEIQEMIGEHRRLLKRIDKAEQMMMSNSSRKLLSENLAFTGEMKRTCSAIRNLCSVLSDTIKELNVCLH